MVKGHLEKFYSLLWVGGFFAAFLLGEGTLRLYRFFFVSASLSESQSILETSHEAQTMSDLPGLFIPDPRVIHRYRPGARIEWGGVWYEINAQGWRGPDWQKVREEDEVILCLGDSITFGYGVPFETVFSKRLEGLLKEKFPRHPPVVLNAASDNYNTEQEVHIFKELIPVVKPDIVIVNFYKNDIKPSPFVVDDQGRLCVPPEAEASPSPFPSRDFFSFLKHRSLLLKFLDERTRSIISLWMFQSPQEARYWQETGQRLRELVQLAHRSRVKVVCAYFPDLHQLGILKINPEFYRFRQICRKLDVPLVDIRKGLQSHRWERCYRKGDPYHLNPRGHELAAYTLEPIVRSRLNKKGD